MGLFNKYQDTDMKEKFHTVNLLLQEQAVNEEVKQILQKVKAEKISAGGTSYCVRCPECNKLIILGSELNIGRAICNKCYTTFNIDLG